MAERTQAARHAVLEAELAATGLGISAWWTDEAGDFALCLAQQA